MVQSSRSPAQSYERAEQQVTGFLDNLSVFLRSDDELDRDPGQSSNLVRFPQPKENQPQRPTPTSSKPIDAKDKSPQSSLPPSQPLQTATEPAQPSSVSQPSREPTQQATVTPSTTVRQAAALEHSITELLELLAPEDRRVTALNALQQLLVLLGGQSPAPAPAIVEELNQLHSQQNQVQSQLSQFHTHQDQVRSQLNQLESRLDQVMALTVRHGKLLAQEQRLNPQPSSAAPAERQHSTETAETASPSAAVVSAKNIDSSASTDLSAVDSSQSSSALELVDSTQATPRETASLATSNESQLTLPNPQSAPTAQAEASPDQQVAIVSTDEPQQLALGQTDSEQPSNTDRVPQTQATQPEAPTQTAIEPLSTPSQLTVDPESIVVHTTAEVTKTVPQTVDPEPSSAPAQESEFESSALPEASTYAAATSDSTSTSETFIPPTPIPTPAMAKSSAAPETTIANSNAIKIDLRATQLDDSSELISADELTAALKLKAANTSSGSTSESSPQFLPFLKMTLLGLGVSAVVGSIWGLYRVFIYPQQALETQLSHTFAADPQLAIYRLDAQVKRNVVELSGILPNRQLRDHARTVVTQQAPNYTIDDQTIVVDQTVAQSVQQMRQTLNQTPGVDFEAAFNAGVVTLSGTAISAEEVERLAAAFAQMPGVESVENQLQVQPLSIPTRIYFEQNSASMPSVDTQRKIMPLAQLLKTHPHLQVQIVGHAHGSERNASIIAKTRAQTIQTALENQGIDRRRLHLLASTQNPPGMTKGADRWLGRCVVFEVIDNSTNKE
ncbi:MAG: BON domain-containing protein [Spirulina sp. SIO3F2]|nr:BON domain-containing protein [Spirulina sp. SIO3F2]